MGFCLQRGNAYFSPREDYVCLVDHLTSPWTRLEARMGGGVCVDWSGVEWNGMGWDGMGWDGME